MYVTTRLGRWFYEERGEAQRPNDPAIVLLHALLFDGSAWDEQIGPLSQLGRVVVIDGPGHGKSEVPPPFSLDDHARALVDALDALGIFKALLVGVSWGGMVAMRVALDNPMRIVGLGLIDTTADAQTRIRRVKDRVMSTVFRTIGLPPSIVEKQIAPMLFAPKTLRERPELAERVYSRVSGFPRLGVSRAVKAVSVERQSILDKVRAISCPTLVVCGREDASAPPARSEAIVNRLPRATMRLIDDAGHASPIEQPEAVNAVLVPFVREHLTSEVQPQV
ncbi:alpha/beta hydrolase [Pendulispora brunnea]|uniref:Alpha/beta hydrolase n=1 Tax=Pendulispora brunnea TaxID=2905690 RepID=A0ABZ2K3N9_9BACT